jgi:ATP-dependent Lhr-like helicase
VGKTSRGKLFPFHGMDLLLAAALKSAVDDRDIEEIRPIENPLDILAQIILALCVEKTWAVDELYATLRGFYVFKSLNRDSFNRVLSMLAGLGEQGRLREIKPRIWLDKVTGEAGALDGSLLLLYSSGGVIANRGLYSLRLTDGVKIGELDEEFVWERRLGDCFDFGGRGWRITAIGAESVEVVPLERPMDYVPFWKADAVFRSANLTGRLLAILDRYNAAGAAGISGLPEPSKTALDDFLNSQRAAQNGLPLPGSGTVTVEIIDSVENKGDLYQAVIHAFRGGAVHYPLSLALAQELEETLKLRVETFSTDDGILFLIPRLGETEGGPAVMEAVFRSAFSALNADGGGGLCRGERLFRNRLESSGVFGASFREAAERSLLLPRAGFGKRTPLWITRQRSKRLFDAVFQENGFPVTAEAWRSCLNDMFDMEGFRDLLCDINDGSIALSFFRASSPSPFSRDMVRQETNALMYEYDERKDLPGRSSDGGPRSASLSDQVIADALGNAALRPQLKPELVKGFVSRLQRLIPGWAPDDELSLCEWVKERIAIPLDEWETLCAALPPALKEPLAADPGLGGRMALVTRTNATLASIVHREWERAWENEALTLLGPWLRYEGPVSVLRITEVFGASAAEAEDAVQALVEIDEIVRDVAIAPNAAEDGRVSDGGVICDRENLDMLLRLSRKKARPVIKERPAALLVPFLAMRQGIGADREPRNDGGSAFPFPQSLAAFAAPAKLWETELFPARSGVYGPEIIDREISEGRLVWYGAGRERIGFCRPEDLDLAFTVARNAEKSDAPSSGLEAAITSGFFDRPRDFWEIKDECIRTRPDAAARECIEALWEAVWHGRLSADSFEPVRRGLKTGFTIPGEAEQNAARELAASPFVPGRRPRLPRALRDRWREGTPLRGGWFSLGLDEAPSGDPLDEEQLNRGRVRLLLNRRGLLCRPLLEHEEAAFSWSGLLPTIRRMELAGELIAGHFFSGINSLQFASPAVAVLLEQAEAFGGLYWMNAADPASPAGLAVEGLDPRFPSRLPGNRLYFRGAELIAVTTRNGKDTRIFIPPEDPALGVLIELFAIPRGRKVLPENRILVETINGADAARGEYAPAFQAGGFVIDRGKLCRW